MLEKMILSLLLGLFAGIISGFVGIGGGVIIVPSLIYIFGFSQKQAQGTTLSLLVPPIGLLAAWTYYKNGFVNINVAIFVCIGFFVGGLVGSQAAVRIPNIVLEKVFGVALLLIGLYVIFKGK